MSYSVYSTYWTISYCGPCASLYLLKGGLSEKEAKRYVEHCDKWSTRLNDENKRQGYHFYTSEDPSTFVTKIFISKGKESFCNDFFFGPVPKGGLKRLCSKENRDSFSPHLWRLKDVYKTKIVPMEDFFVSVVSIISINHEHSFVKYWDVDQSCISAEKALMYYNELFSDVITPECIKREIIDRLLGALNQINEDYDQYYNFTFCLDLIKYFPISMIKRKFNFCLDEIRYVPKGRFKSIPDGGICFQEIRDSLSGPV